MSSQEPSALGDELTASEIDPVHYAILPSDDAQDLAFRSIRGINPGALAPHGPASLEPTRRTPKGTRPMIWVRLTEIKTSVVFDVTLHTGQCIQAHVPIDSWRLGSCDSEAVRAAIQMAYLCLLCQMPGSFFVRPGTVCREILSRNEPQIGYIDKAIDRVKQWNDCKRRRRKKADKPGASHRKDRLGGAISGREEGNRSGSGSGSGELTYSESRSSASSYTSENSASENAAEPSTETEGLFTTVTSPTSSWAQSLPTSQAHIFGPVSGQLSPTDPIVRLPMQFQPSERHGMPHNFQILPSAQRQSPIPMSRNYSPTPMSSYQRQQQQLQMPSQPPQSHSSTPNFQFGRGLQQSSMCGLQSQQLPSPPPIDPRHFELLVNILAEFRNEGKPRPYRSKIGSELVTHDRLVYQRAGVTGFRDYVRSAEQMGIVKLGGSSGSPGKEWIELIVD